MQIINSIQLVKLYVVFNYYCHIPILNIPDNDPKSVPTPMVSGGWLVHAGGPFSDWLAAREVAIQQLLGIFLPGIGQGPAHLTVIFAWEKKMWKGQNPMVSWEKYDNHLELSCFFCLFMA